MPHVGVIGGSIGGLTAALAPDWRGGVTCQVIEAGAVRVGDDVLLLA